MVSKRSLAALAAALGLLASGVAGALAWTNGFYGTVLFCCLVAIWLSALVWWAVTQPRAMKLAAPSPQQDHEGDRIMLRALLDQAPIPMLAVEGGRRVRALNRAARQWFATDDLLLSPPSALLAPDSPRLRHGDRNWRIDRVETEGLGTARTIVALIDVEPEERAAEARAVREVLQLLGHEVMNGLSPIASLAESALAAHHAPDRRDDLLPEILGTLARRAEALQRFTEAYRQMAQLPAPEIAPNPVAPLFDDLARLFAIEWQERVRLLVSPPAENEAALIDSDQITQALWALLRNAAEAALDASPVPQVELRCRVVGDSVVFEVSDIGAGIAGENRDAIFRAFFTTKPAGTGIGLYLARQIARAHGGDLALLENGETTFALHVARAAPLSD